MRAGLVALALLAGAHPSLAAPAASCHCFRDRSFDPSAPAAADPYVLATAQSSLLAAVFGLEKRAVVASKMAGARPEDFWIRELVAQKSGVKPAALDEARCRSGSWKQA